MQKFTFIVAVGILIMSCSKQQTPFVPVNQAPDTSAVQKFAGSFSNGPYGTVSGNAKIFLQNGQYLLKLENLSSSAGPDLHVYLSKEVQPVNYIDLGRLQSTAGNQLYAIAGTPDFSAYKYALIHCQRFNHLFGSAELR